MIRWHSVPFARVLIPTVTGILSGHFLKPQSLILSFAALTCFTLIYAVSHFKKAFFWAPSNSISFLILTGFHCGFHLLSLLSDSSVKEGHYSNTYKGENYQLVKIIEIKNDTSVRLRAVVEIMSLGNPNKTFRPCHGKAMLKLTVDSKDSMPEEGDLIITKGKLTDVNLPEGEWAFNYKAYLLNQDIQKQLIARNYVRTGQTIDDLKTVSLRLRKKILRQIEKLYHNRSHAGFIQALILGYRLNTTQEMNNDFAITGTLHVLAVSGMHVGLIYAILNVFLGFLKNHKIGKFLRLGMVLTGLWTFVFITGCGASILRAGIMFSLFLIAESSNRENQFFNTLFSSAFIILLIDPNALFDPGFQLSYAAVAGIVHGQQLFRIRSKNGNRVTGWLRSMVISTLCAQIYTLPLSIYYFNQFPVYFIPANLIAVPATSLIMLLGLLSLSTGFIAVFCQKVCALTGFLIDQTLNINHFFSGLPFETIGFLHWNLLMVITWMVLAVVFLEKKHCEEKKRWHSEMILILLFFLVNLIDKIHLKNEKKVIIFYQKKGDEIKISIEKRMMTIKRDSKNIKFSESEIKKIETIAHYYSIQKVKLD